MPPPLSLSLAFFPRPTAIIAPFWSTQRKHTCGRTKDYTSYTCYTRYTCSTQREHTCETPTPWSAAMPCTSGFDNGQPRIAEYASKTMPCVTCATCVTCVTHVTCVTCVTCVAYVTSGDSTCNVWYA